jgi:hypothetical protein
MLSGVNQSRSLLGREGDLGVQAGKGATPTLGGNRGVEQAMAGARSGEPALVVTPCCLGLLRLLRLLLYAVWSWTGLESVIVDSLAPELC